MKIKLFLFFVLFFISSNSISVDDINDICKEGSQKLKDYYFDNKEYPAKTFPKNSESYIPTIINAIDTKNINSLIKDKNFLKSYGKHIVIFVFFLLCGFLSILGIIVCCFNYLCCNCCFCFLKKCCTRCISFLVTIGIFGSIIFICFYGVATAKESIIGFNNVACSLLKFTSDIIDGQSKNSYPKWVGINKLTNTFNDIKDNLNQSQNQNGKDFYTNYDLLIKKQSDYSDYLGVNGYINKNKDNSGKSYYIPLDKTTFIYLDEDINLIPSYIKNWEDSITFPNGNSVIRDHLILTNVLLSGMKICENISTGYDCTKESIIYKELNKGTTHIYTLQNTITDLKNSFVEPFYEYEKMLSDYGKKYVKYVFYVIMLISGFLTALNIILNCDCDSKMNCVAKILLYIFWIIISIVMIISFILGGLLGIIGNVSKDLTYVIGEILDKDNLNKINPVILKGDGVKYINICLYDKDKNLANTFLSNVDDDSSPSSSDTSVTNFLAQMPGLYENLLLDEKKLNEVKNEEIFDNLKNEIDNSKDKYLNIDYYNDDGTIHNMSKYFDDFNGYTCRKYNSSCEIKHYWSTSSSENNKNIYNLTLDYYLDNNCNFDTNYHFSKLNDASDYYYNFFNEIKTGNNQTINNLDMTTQNYSDILNYYSTVLDALKNTTKYAIILTGSIANAYNAILGNGQFNQLLDCGFIKDDLNILLNELHSKLANSLIKFGTTFCIISCLIAIGICMMLLNLTLSNESKDEKKKVYNKNRKNVKKQYENNEVNSERMILKENK